MSSFPGYSEDAALDLPGSSAVQSSIVARLADKSLGAFSETLAMVGNCARPIRLVGSSETIERATGEITRSFASADAPLGMLHVPCGNRREAVCPACARTYAADTFQMIRSGVTGGKTVPVTIADNPLVFATLTAPSFGAVHGIRSDGSCRRGRGKCGHGLPRGCGLRHGDGDAALGAPICSACYDQKTQVVWQWWAPELWRRFTIALRRQLASAVGVPEARLNGAVTVQYAKVAEFQARGAVHFHALVRLDGPRTNEGFGAAPDSVTASMLSEMVASSAASVRMEAPPTEADDGARVLRFGRQTDVRIVATHRRLDTPGVVLDAGQVAGYLAKYASKASADTIDHGPQSHYRQLSKVAQRIGDAAAVRAAQIRSRGGVEPTEEADPYERMVKWTASLGFRGHFSTKSRRYSITLGALRRARRRWRQLAAEIGDTSTLDTAELEARLLADDEDDTTVVVGSWTFAGSGWSNSGDEALARAAAGRAREYDQWKASQGSKHLRGRENDG